MKLFFTCVASAALLVGCASTENGRVEQTPNGTHYGLDDQPQSSIAGEGPLMPGAYDSHNPLTGQFTGQERSSEMIGVRPTLPREADARQMDRSVPVQLGTGAGSLGQSGIVMGEPAVNGTALLDKPLNPGAEPSASDIYRPSASDTSAVGVGRAPETEIGRNAATNNPTVPNRVDEKPKAP